MAENVLEQFHIIVYLNVDDVGEVSGLFEVVEALGLHQLSNDLVGHLVSPVVGHRHVDVVDEHGHLLAGRRSVGATHVSFDVALDRSLRCQRDRTSRDHHKCSCTVATKANLIRLPRAHECISNTGNHLQRKRFLSLSHSARVT